MASIAEMKKARSPARLVLPCVLGLLLVQVDATASPTPASADGIPPAITYTLAALLLIVLLIGCRSSCNAARKERETETQLTQLQSSAQALKTRTKQQQQQIHNTTIRSRQLLTSQRLALAPSVVKFPKLGG